MALVPASTYGPAPVQYRGAAVGPPRPPDELPKGTNVLGVLLVIVADAMLLVGLLTVWFTIKGGSPAWPPRGVGLNTYLPSVITITAAMSACSMQWMVSSIRRNDQRSGGVALFLTVLFGIAIVNAEWYLMVRAPFGIRSSAYGTLYHLLIGYHAVNLTAAVAAVVIVGARALAGHFGRQGYDPLRAVNAFWQFSIVAWFAVLSAVYLFSAVN